MRKTELNQTGPRQNGESRGGIVRFLLSFSAVVALLELFVVSPLASSALFDSYLEATARVASLILSAIGYEACSTEATMCINSRSLAIDRGCAAEEACVLFVAAVLIYPAKTMLKIAGVALGGLAILGLNLIRIVSLASFYVESPGLFETMHLRVWPVAMVLAAFLVWIVWVSRAVQSGNSLREPPPN